jgi:hypothetical protein
MRICQGGWAFSAVTTYLWLAATGLSAQPQPSQTPPTAALPRIEMWSPKAFATVACDTPELAACFLSAPAWWSGAITPPSLPDSAALALTLSAQLKGVADGALAHTTVVVGAAETNAVHTLVYGDAVFVVVPLKPPTTVEEIAFATAPAWLAARLSPAPPDRRASEPLLTLGESLAAAGSLALAALPPPLRPVREWLEVDEAKPALAGFVQDALAVETPWQTRRARLVRAQQVGGAVPALATAAALVLESTGDPERARHEPLDFLLAWSKSTDKNVPPLPRALRRALDKPGEAGMPTTAHAADREAIALDALARQLVSGTPQIGDMPATIPVPQRVRAAAFLRARGSPGLCAWLTAAALGPLRTGCRSEGEDAGFVFARPRSGAGCEIVWRSLSGIEAPLLIWPRWVLSPQVVTALAELWFIDPSGIWRLPLDGSASPRLTSPGAYRHLAAAPSNSTLAAARWPAGQTVVIAPTGVREHAVDARGGLAWVAADVLLASDGDNLVLLSTRGEVRPTGIRVRCCGSLTARGTSVTAAVITPCEPALVQLDLATGKLNPALHLPQDPFGIVALPDGSLAYGTVEGIWRWRGAGQSERVGAGLTPGPG